MGADWHCVTSICRRMLRWRLLEARAILYEAAPCTHACTSMRSCSGPNRLLEEVGPLHMPPPPPNSNMKASPALESADIMRVPSCAVLSRYTKLHNSEARGVRRRSFYFENHKSWGSTSNCGRRSGSLQEPQKKTETLVRASLQRGFPYTLSPLC